MRSNSSAASKRRTRSDRKLQLQASQTSLHASDENPKFQEADAIIEDDEKPFAELEVNAAAEVGHSSSSVALKTQQSLPIYTNSNEASSIVQSGAGK